MILIAMLVGLTACGSDDSSSLSKEEYTQQLKLVCNEGLKDRETLTRELAKDYYENRAQNPTPEYQAENLVKMIHVYQGTTQSIADIGMPEGEEKKVEEFIREREEAAAKVEASPIGTRDAIETIFKEANEQAAALGAEGCVL
ncbi:MAG TPA: hypothetical protein VFN92_01780 [Solirubrobacterales bacterium]|nr:hypothetical protein [Solirubrobacterales bacterium]